MHPVWQICLLISESNWSTTKLTGETAQGAVLKAWLVVMSVAALLLTGVSARGAANGGQMLTSGRSLVSGTVQSDDGRPVAMTRVEMQSTMGSFVLTAYTDSAGHFTLPSVPQGNYLVMIRAVGYETFNGLLDVGYSPTQSLVFSLAPINFGRPREQGFAENSGSTVSVRQLRIPDKARKEFRKGVESESHGKIDEAIKHWQKSIEIYPEFAESYMELSKVYAIRGDYDNATKAAKSAIGIDDKEAAPYAYLGFVYMKQKDPAKATKAFQDSVRLSDSNFFSQFWLGALLLKQKDFEKAYPHLARAWQLKPDEPRVYLLLYNDLVLLGRGEEALAKIDDFLSRFPNNPVAAEVRVKRDELAKSLEEGKH
jgi:Flp pilus assembly protein TadD